MITINNNKNNNEMNNNDDENEKINKNKVIITKCVKEFIQIYMIILQCRL